MPGDGWEGFIGKIKILTLLNIRVACALNSPGKQRVFW